MPHDELLTRIALLLAAILGVMAIALFARARGARSAPAARTSAPAPAAPAPAATPAPGGRTEIAWHDPVTELMTLAVYRRAFGIANFNYSVLGEHAGVMERVRRALPQAAERREYFPRKPLVVPRLLAAIRNSDSSLKELVGIIMQDPVLTGDVLRHANSPMYRVSREPVDSIGRAVVLLGMDGLRSLIATSVMQPVFQVPKGYFEDFSQTVWRQAQHSAVAAQAYARLKRDADSFSAHLLALLFHMSHIVLFRMSVASYVDAAGSLPRAEVFTRLIDECAEELAEHIAREWELPEAMTAALAEHVRRCPVERMSPLARALYVGRICGLAAIAVQEGALQDEEVLQLLQRKGLDAAGAAALWGATAAHEEPAR
jgi:HD-like signal output (HDOD) protein